MSFLGKVMNPLAAVGPSALGFAGDIYSAHQQSRNVEKTNATNKYLAAADMAFNSAEAEKARIFSAEEAAKANAFSASQATAQREWEERMSNTSWSRGIEDMKRAGINPIFAASQGGASTPGGASAAGHAGSPSSASAKSQGVIPVPAPLMHVMSSAKDLIRMVVDLKQSMANIRNTNSNTQANIAKTQESLSRADLTSSQRDMLNIDLRRQLRALAWENKAPRFTGFVDAFEKRLGPAVPIVNSVLGLMIGGKALRALKMRSSAFEPSRRDLYIKDYYRNRFGN